jgi:hypothetical protein
MRVCPDHPPPDPEAKRTESGHDHDRAAEDAAGDLGYVREDGVRVLFPTAYAEPMSLLEGEDSSALRKSSAIYRMEIDEVQEFLRENGLPSTNFEALYSLAVENRARISELTKHVPVKELPRAERKVPPPQEEAETPAPPCNE